MHTTLNTIKSHYPCVEGWKTLLKGLNKLEADDEPLHLLEILRINGAEDALWSLRAFSAVECQLFAIGAARQVKNLSVSSENLINTAEAYILQVPVNGVSPPSLSELKMALSKAEEARRVAAVAVAVAAWAARAAVSAWAAAAEEAVAATTRAAEEAAEAARAAVWAMWAAEEAAGWAAGARAVLEEIIKEACTYVESRNG